MRAFDTDRDGKVTKDEFMATVRSRFAQLDLNNDGRITDEDLPPRLRGRDILASDSRWVVVPAVASLGCCVTPTLTRTASSRSTRPWLPPTSASQVSTATRMA